MHSSINFFFLTLLLIAVSQTTFAAGCPPPYGSLIQNGAYGVSDLQGKIVEGCNLDTPYIPASILKVPTALVALSILGPAYRFTTRFYIDKQNNLYIQGFGDPLLIPEEIRLIVATLKQRGLQQINAIYIDDANFALEYQTPGSEFSNNPYDAPVGATVVNFNSVPIQVKKGGLVFSGGPNTPLLPIMSELATGYPPGKRRVNICQGGCRNTNQQMARYTAELFRAIQEEQGIPGQGEMGRKRIPATARLLYEHHNSKNLLDLTSSFLKYSSNFISNLVYLAVGAKKFGWPATWAKADRAVEQELVRQLGPKTAAAIVHKDGAGLYRGDRVTARAMLEVLRIFRPYAWLLRKHQGVPTKSGSMKGVWNYVGYLKDGRPYVILLNQQANRRITVLRRLLGKDVGKKRTASKTKRVLKKKYKRAVKKKR
jgi:D-alanyl-D-alanine carboxypeptidase/D-alanyl-D-alanine-endopeptidase (penicillin-binding protein 4)